MGKATRWLKGLLGMKKDKEKDQMEQCSSNSPVLSDKKEKKRWSFGKSSGKDANEIPQMPASSPRNVPTTVGTDVAWLRSSYNAETVNEQNKHAIAVAAATAAAADAAVAAAQVAMAVVRLTSNGRGTLFGGARERWAAMKIQTVFRGYLSRKALRALKGLVRLQALVRGYLVRKRTTATLHSMQALIRAQTAVRSQRIFRSFNNKESRHWPENRPRKSIERLDEPRNEIHSKRLSASMEVSLYDDSPRIVEIDTFKTRSRSRRFNIALSECEDDLPCQNQTISSTLHCQNLHDFEWCFATAADDECRLSTTQSTPRFGECRLSTAQSTPRFGNTVRSNAPATPARSVCGDAYFKPYLPNYMANTQSFKAKLRSHSAPKQRPEPGGGAKKRLSLNEVIGARNSISGVRMNRSCYQLKEANDECRLSKAQSTPRFGECRLSTAQSTPRFGNTVRSNAPATQTRSVCGDAYFKPYLFNYMAKTQSFKAKLRSHSAPKQRPEPGGGAKKRLSLNEVIGARNSISGVRMNRSCYQLEEGLEFGD